MKTLEELQILILEWANEKDLLKKENAPKQRLKLIEECGELASAILKNDIKEQKDAIGDIFVVLIILAKQLENEIEVKKLSNVILNIELSMALNYLINNSTFIKEISSCFTILSYLSIKLEHDFNECANIAWNEIKNRKGKTINGIFIKS